MMLEKTKSRQHTISSKVTMDQYEMVARRAQADGVTLSEYVRLRSLAGPDARIVAEHLRAVMAEICALRTIISYTVANLTTGQKIDAAFMKELFAEADAAKEHQADTNFARARLRGLQER